MLMNSKKPYLLRAISEWILDNSYTPYLVVDAIGDQVSVPAEYIQNGKIILNIRPDALRDLVLANESVSFEARFSGTPYQIYIPMANILAIYAHENGQGLVFDEDEAELKPDLDAADPDSKEVKKSSKVSYLKVVK